MCGFAGFVGKVEDRETVLVNMMDTNHITEDRTVQGNMLMRMRLLDFGV